MMMFAREITGDGLAQPSVLLVRRRTKKGRR